MSNKVTIAGKRPTLLEIRSDSKQFPRLIAYPKEEAINRVSEMVLLAYQYRGQEADISNVYMIASNLVEELLADEDGYGSQFITLEEIHRVIKRAVLGQGKELYGISFASLYAAIMDYVKNEGHQVQRQATEENRKKQRAALNEAMPKPYNLIEKYANALIKNQ